MILHIINDQKFLDSAYYMFELVAPGKNSYIIISSNDKYRHINTFNPTLVSPRDCLKKKFIDNLCSYEIVFIHSLHTVMNSLIKKSSEKVNFVWIGWGHDYYQLIYPDSSQLLLPDTKYLHNRLSQFYVINCILENVTKTRRFFCRAKSLDNFITLAVGKYLTTIEATTKLIKNIIRPPEKYLRALNKKIKYFAPVLFEDYQLLIQKTPEFKPKYVAWNYGGTAKFIEELEKYPFQTIGNNILLGNSATFTNNHLDAFTFIKKINLGLRQIICPLSYGNPEYAKAIRSEGQRLFGSNFKGLYNFIPFDDYIKILSSCSIAIMNHVRQQAVGNINTMLYLGAMVFLRKENSYYVFLKQEGATVFTVEELEQTLLANRNGLSQEQILGNQEIIKRNFSHDAIRQKTVNLIETTTRTH